MKNMSRVVKILIMAVLLLLGTMLCVYAKQDNENTVLYNRNEIVNLSVPLLYTNDTYYISVNDLEKINLEYSRSVDARDNYSIRIFSTDALGEENVLKISASMQEISKWDPDFGELGGFVTQYYYAFSNSMRAKKMLKADYNGVHVTDIYLDDEESVVSNNSIFYVSLKKIGQAISYEYKVENSAVYLWITDNQHIVLNGNIYLPDEKKAPTGGIDIDILLRNTDNTEISHYSVGKVNIPENENSVYYFAEFDVLNSQDKYLNVMFDFNADYKTVCNFCNIKTGRLYDVKTSETEKTDFNINIFMPDNMTANEDVYGIVIFDNGAVYVNDTPLIKKGESRGKISLDIASDFFGKVFIEDITGDNRLFPYGYYKRDGLSLVSDNADFVRVSYDSIDISLLGGYTISGKVYSTLLGKYYEVRAFGYTVDDEKLYLHDTVDENMNFEIRLPCSMPTYTLSVCNILGAYCGYISDEKSSFKGPFTYFENNKDYSDIKLNYIPFKPDYPIEITANITRGKVYLKNLSDYTFNALQLFCAYYRDNSLRSVFETKIEKSEPYGDSIMYEFEFPDDFYKADTVKFFLWEDNLQPISLAAGESVNHAEQPEREMMMFTEGVSDALFCEKTVMLDSKPIMKNGTMFVAVDELVFLDFYIDDKSYENRLYLTRNEHTAGFEVGKSSLIYNSDEELFDISPPFEEKGKIYVSIDDIGSIFGLSIYYFDDNSVIVNNNFADVLPDNKYFEAVTAMYYQGVVLGYEDKTFKPELNVMRNEAARMLCRLLDYYCTLYDFSCDDVPDDDWAKSFIGICINEGIFELEDNKFRPYDNITIREVLQAMVNTAGRADEHFDSAVNNMKLLNNVEGDNLDKDITRAELVQIFHNYKKYNK